MHMKAKHEDQKCDKVMSVQSYRTSQQAMTDENRAIVE
jgi:hypothetical protein